MHRHNVHIEAVEFVARKLAMLEKEVVFTGGAIVGLLLTEPAAPDIRPTDDVDVIVGVIRYSDYANIQQKLRALGFVHDLNGPNCRFIVNGLTVDVMPSKGEVLGFTNSWYKYAIDSAIDYLLPNGTRIKLIAPVAFIATKLGAFHTRGNDDYMLSHDIEDIITVIDGRPKLGSEVKVSPADVRKYVCGQFAKLINDSSLIDAISSHLTPDEGSQARRGIIYASVIGAG